MQSDKLKFVCMRSCVPDLCHVCVYVCLQTVEKQHKEIEELKQQLKQVRATHVHNAALSPSTVRHTCYTTARKGFMLSIA